MGVLPNHPFVDGMFHYKPSILDIPIYGPYVLHHIIYPLVNIQKNTETGHLQLIYHLNMVMFHSFFVCLPEGKLM